MFEILDPNTLAGAAAGAGFGALAKVFDGPFKSIEDLWYIHFGHKLALQRAKYEASVEALKTETISELQKIKPENQIEPKLCIAGPAMDAAKYFVEEPDLRSMFAKLIASASDISKVTTVHPAFVEIIKQLTPFEAKILKNTNILFSAKPICKLRVQDKKGYNNSTLFRPMSKGRNLVNHIIFFENIEVKKEDLEFYTLILDNLTRLNLCEIPANYTLSDNNLYKIYEDSDVLKAYIQFLKVSKYEGENEEICLLKETCMPTALGEAFYNTCIR